MEKLYMAFWKQALPEQKPRFFIQWHLLDHCNLHCTHCYQPENVPEQLSMTQVSHILSKLDEFFKEKDVTPQINLTGGEPLLHPNLLNLIDEIRSRGWLWALLTNGTLLSPETVVKLKQRQPVFVQVSLEGGEEKNDACRGKGTFDLICHAMKLLVNAEIKTLVSFTVTSENWYDFPKVAEICRQYKVHKLWCDRYVGNDALTLSTDDFMHFLTLLKEVKEKRRSTTKIAAERALQFLAGGKGYHCSAGGSLLVLLPDGTLLPCRRLPLPLGNVLGDESIQSILDHSSVWAELQKKRLSTSCISCPHLRGCLGGAKCITYAQTGKLHGKDVNCPLYK